MTGIDRVVAWLESRGRQPFDFQREAWRAYLAGESGLVHAGTGTGKTYAAWLGPVAEGLDDNSGENPAPLTVLWVTPLRALAADTLAALRAPIQDLKLPWTVEARTGDTSSSARARQKKRLPTALVTTPESLSLLLSYPDSAAALGTARAVVVDEWHELLGSKRGVQVELALARLRGMQPALRVWGLSATLGNLDGALQCLLGAGRTGRLVRGALPKEIVVDAALPPAVQRFPWGGRSGLELLPQVADAIDESASTLLFTNTRSLTETWYQALLEARPDWAGELALHHGSLDRATRDWVEAGLRDGRLKCVVCTSTLDLGVDFSPVDRVLQVGSPKGIARLQQRAGRSGHGPGRRSRVTCVPTHAFELVEVAAARRGIDGGRIEARVPVTLALDCLVQHLVTVAAGGGFRPDELLNEVRTTHAFRELSDADWRWALDFVARGGGSLQAYPEFRRVIDDGGRWRVADGPVARRHRLAIGTIVSEASVTVQFLMGGRLGTVEESFVARLKSGDCFLFAGRLLEFVRLRDMTAWVRAARSGATTVPRWSGSRLPISDALGAEVRALLDEARDGRFPEPELVRVKPLLDLQRRWSALPPRGTLLVERIRARDGHHLFFYPFAGRLVHEGLAALFAYRISRLMPISFALAANDYGFDLLSPDPAPLDDALAAGLLSSRGLADDLLAAVNAAELARRQFREIARIAGLVFPGYPGSGKTARQLQVSSGLLYDVFCRYDPDNRLLAQAQREVVERQFEVRRLAAALDALAAGPLLVTQPRRVTPLAFPLLVEGFREKLTSEKLADRVRRMQAQLERAAGTEREPRRRRAVPESALDVPR